MVALCSAVIPAPARTVTDSAGRVVEIPDEVSRVFAVGPPASILVYALKPESLLGWPRALRDYEKPHIAKPWRELPETGRLTGRGGDANLERVLLLEPDLIIDFGSVRDTYIDLANRVQEQSGIPYILVNGRFSETAASLRLVGEALGVRERGEALATDVEATFAALLVGPAFGVLLPAAALLGAGYMLAVDTLARTISAAEVPLGILTAVVGAPFFLWLLARGRRAWA